MFIVVAKFVSFVAVVAVVTVVAVGMFITLCLSLIVQR